MTHVIFLVFLSLNLGAFELKVGDVLLQPLSCWSCSLIEAQEKSIYSHMGVVIENDPEVLVAEASSSRWALRVGGVGAPRAEAFGWANRFTVAEGAEGSLQFRTPPWRYLAVLVQLGLWVAAVVLVIRARRREVVR